MTSTLKAGTYAIDPTHTAVEFAVKHMMITTVKGRFTDVKGTLDVPATGEPTLDVAIGVASINTGVEARDTHLRSADFFDVGKRPDMRFVSSSARRVGGEWTLTGELTMNGFTKPITLRVSEEGAGVDPWGNQKVAFSATGKLNRSDFGLTWNAALETGGVLVSEEVRILIEAQLVRNASAKAA